VKDGPARIADTVEMPASANATRARHRVSSRAASVEIIEIENAKS
jgi:hypothetical protein